MYRRRRSLRLVALAVTMALPLFATSAVASAKASAKVGCHKTHSCKSAGGSGSAGGGAPGPITVQIDPNPLIETGTSEVVATIQVETSPAFAGYLVSISSSQLDAACDGEMDIKSIPEGIYGPGSIQVPLDDDGNATVFVVGDDCAPGPSVFEADLTVAPYYTALATLDALPPVVTTPGVYGYPTTSGAVTGGEVETGDTGSKFEGSYVYTVFYVETDPVYAEQTVEISSSQLQDRCGTLWQFSGFNPPDTFSYGVGSVLDPASPATASATLDDDGNAVFLFEGASCAAGPSEVIADVEAGTHPTYTTTFNIDPPQPTI